RGHKMGDINIDDKSKAYRDEVNAILKEKIDRNVAGHVILQYIDVNSHSIKIVPYKRSGANARSGPDDMNDPAIHPKGEYFYVASDPIHYAQSKVPGKGGGADLEIEFTPDNYNASSKPVGVYRSQADDALFHELIHSLRMMEGVFNPIPMPKIGFQDEEEYLA